MQILDVLTNKNFKVLSCLYDNRGKDNIARITQNEIADEIGYSRPTVSEIFVVLKREGLVKDTNFVGRYEITDAGIKIVKLFRKIE